MAMWIQIGGALGAAFVAGQAGLALAQAAGRARMDRTRRRMEISMLRARLNALRAAKPAALVELAAWNGWRKFRVREKVAESKDVFSFYLVPHDGKRLPPFKPGQFLTFRLAVKGSDKPVVRCYSLSDAPDPSTYRVSIKRAGLASNHFADQVQPGDILDVRAPSGHFHLHDDEEPAVLVGGGIGVTPVLSMLKTLVAEGSRREIYFFYGARDGSDAPLRTEIEEAARGRSNVRVEICYSRPAPGEKAGTHFHTEGRVTVDLLRERLKSSSAQFYVCGPPAMMESIVKGLEDWGVPSDRLFFEAFGPASVKKAAAAPTAAVAVPAGSTVTFAKTGKSFPWGSAANLLEFALAQGVRLDSGCGAGNCGTCLTAIKAGDVTYVKTPDSPPDQGTCLACIAVPRGDLTLDA